MNHSERLIRRNLTGAIAARLCLIVSLWQAPVPWLHRHGTDVSKATSAVSAMALKTHLAVFHPSTNANFDTDFGWHCHWVYPSWTHVLGQTRDDQLPAEESVAFEPAIASSELPDLYRPLDTLSVTSELRPTMDVARNSSPQTWPAGSFIPPRESFFVLRC